MADIKNFNDFDNVTAPSEAGTNEAGVLLTDTFETWREKTNGIVAQVKTNSEFAAAKANAALLDAAGVQTFQKPIKATLSTIDVTSSTFTVDLTTSNVFVINLKSGIGTTATMTLSNIASVSGGAFTMVIKNEGDFDIDYPDTMFFSGGDPSVTTGGTSSTPTVDILSGISDGTNFYASYNFNLEAATGNS